MSDELTRGEVMLLIYIVGTVLWFKFFAWIGTVLTGIFRWAKHQ